MVGTLPPFLRRMAMSTSDRSFQRRLETDYPPGYMPPDLQLLIEAHNQQFRGRSLFAFDLYHSQPRGSGSQTDTVVLLADMHFDHSLWTQARVNYNQSDSSGPGQGSRKTLDGYIRAGYDWDGGQEVLVSLGAYQRKEMALSQTDYNALVSYRGHIGRWFPIRTTAEYHRPDTGQSWWSFYLNVDMQYYLFRGRVFYQMDRMPNYTVHRFGVDLSRSFYRGF